MSNRYDLSPNGIVQLFLSLAHRQARDHHRIYPLEGVRFVTQAALARRPVAHLIVSKELLTSPAGRNAVRTLSARGTPVTRVSAETFRRLSTARRASGIAAIAAQHWSPAGRSPIAPGQLWLGVRRIDSPGNLGTLMRAAQAFGAAGFVCFGDLVDPFDPAVVRASMGGICHIQLYRTTHRQLAAERSVTPLRILGATADGKTQLDATTFDARGALVLLGNERKGLTPEEVALCDETIRIPTCGPLSSLNVAVAGSVILYQSMRPSPHSV